MTVSKMNGRVFFPGPEFDAQFREFVDLALKEGWIFLAPALESLQADVTAQIEERRAVAAAEAEYRAKYEAFCQAQWGRHHAYMSALNVARAMFRNDEEKLALLSRFKRTRPRHKKADVAMPPQAAPATT
jgi:hypothetical protein